MSDAAHASVILTALLWYALLTILIVRRGLPYLAASIPGALFLAVMAAGLVTASVTVWSGPASLEGWLWSSADVSHGALIFVIAAVSAQAGVAVVSIFAGGAQTGATTNVALSPAIFVAARWSVVPMIVGYAALFGLGDLVSRSRYGVELPFGLGAVAGPFLLLLQFLAALLVCSRNQTDRQIGWLGVALIALVLFGTGSRQLGLLPIILLGVSTVLNGRFRWRTTTVALFLSYVGVGLATANRGFGAPHGLMPYLSHLVEEPVRLTREVISLPLANIGAALPITDLSSRSSRVSAETMFVALDPFTSSASWQAIAPSLRVHYAIPFSGLGELAAAGIATLVIACIALGAVCAMSLRLLGANFGYVGLLLGAGLVLYASVLLTQYNLRASARFIYGLLLLVLVGVAIRAAMVAARKSRTTRTRSAYTRR